MGPWQYMRLGSAGRRYDHEFRGIATLLPPVCREPAVYGGILVGPAKHPRTMSRTGASGLLYPPPKNLEPLGFRIQGPRNIFDGVERLERYFGVLV